MSFSDEKADPDLYADNISKLMSRESGIPQTDRSALDYLADIQSMRDECPDLKMTGWKRLLTCGSELQSAPLRKLNKLNGHHSILHKYQRIFHLFSFLNGL